MAWLAVGAVALALRLLHLRQIAGAPVFDHLVCDGVAYDAWARDVASGNWLGHEVFYQAPLYPYFLGTIYALVGHDLVVVRVAQALLGAAACVLLGVAGARFFDRRVGVAAGLLLAVWPSAVFADSLVQKSVLDVFFVCALLAAVATARDAGRPSRWLVAGLVLGALALTRENTLVLAPVLVGWIVATRRGACAVAWLALGMALVLAPVAARNRVVGGELHLTTSQLGPNFFIGNNERATGGYRPLRHGRSDPRFERRDATELAEQALGRPLTPGEVSSYWTGRALEFVGGHPVAWLRLLGRKAVLFVNRIELGDAEDQYTYGDWSTLLAVLNPILAFGVLVPVAGAGIVLTWRTARVRLLVAMLAIYALTVVGTFVMARYRHPILPLLLLFAVAGADAIPRAPARRRAIAALVALVLAIPANWPMVSEATVRAGSLYNIARGLEDDPHGLAAAADYYRRAIALDPAYALAHSNLGTVLERLGRLDDARASLERAVELEPGRAEYWYNLAHVDAARGDGASAESRYERALALDPANPEAHTNLGVLLQQRGALDAAIGHYDAALAAAPTHLEALNDRGIAYAQQGKLDAAIASFRAALGVDAGDPSAAENLVVALGAAGRRDEALAQLDAMAARAARDPELRARLDALRRRLDAR